MARQSIEALRREELIVAALDVVAIEGHDAATTQRIGRAAEISPGVVHHYFGDKHRLMLAAMRAVRKPVAAAYRARLTEENGEDRTALDAVLDAHLDPAILTVRRAAAWLQFTARVAYEPDYARIHAAVRCRQVAALRRALIPIAREADAAPALAVRAATALDGYWFEAATREGGLAPGEARGAMDALLADSIW